MYYQESYHNSGIGHCHPPGKENQDNIAVFRVSKYIRHDGIVVPSSLFNF